MGAGGGGVWPWVVMAGLGAYHGLNPAMGWLFAVGLGLQDRSRRSVLRALPPITLGHGLALTAVVLVVLALGDVVDPGALRTAAAVVLIAFGVVRLVKPNLHPRWVRFRVNRRELAWWSFLMSTAHGAGLMVVPVLLAAGASAEASGGGHMAGMGAMSLPASALALVVHVGAMIAVMTVLALLVYEKLGVAVLRRAWVNLDVVWAAAFVVAGAVTLVV